MSDSDSNQLVKEVTDIVDKMAELSYTTAEHHPYWKLLYSCAEISKTTLEKWNSELTSDELDEEFNQETEEELLDIPTFLRRQAN